MNISAKDREILRGQVSDKISELLPQATDALGGSWRARFKRLAREARVAANGCPQMSEAHEEYMGYAVAYELILDDYS